MSRRSAARRNIKRRGVVPSFGDMILPIVGFAAVILLVLAGRQFFLNGLKTSPGISSTRAFAEAPALIAERENKSASTALIPQDLDKNESVKDVKESGENNKVLGNMTEDEFLAVAVATQAPAPQVSSTMRLQVPKTTAKTSIQKPSSSQKSTTKSAQKSSPPTMASMMKQWRVQIGAYTSKSGAQEAAKKINKAGYRAIVYQNPASKHFKVWVEGGATKKSAEVVVSAMQKIGYKGSFSFPPAK